MEEIKIIGIIFLFTFIWMAFEFWRAPTYKENPNGKYTELKPTKKLSDLFKKRKK